MTNWKTLYQQSAKSLKELHLFFNDSPDHLKALPQSFNEKKYPIFIPYFFLEKIKNYPPSSPLWRQFIPHEDELLDQVGLTDPIGDEKHQKTKQLIHRYHNRVLFIPHSICPIHCRYCFRKNELYGENKLFKPDFSETINYLKNHPEVEEVIFTGGDPLILSNEKLNQILEKLIPIKHIKFIRFHTRMPIILPHRLDQGLLKLVIHHKDRFNFQLMIHINHPHEWSSLLEKQINLFRPYLYIFSQTVLLKNINDHELTLIKLFKKLAHSQVIPYYLHHPDQARGTHHFNLSLERGREIYTKLRNQLSGWMLPQYVIDIPNGHGKSPAYNPETLKFSGQLFDKNGQKRILTSSKSKDNLHSLLVEQKENLQ